MTPDHVPPPRLAALGRAGAATRDHIGQLQRGYRADEAAAVARVAQIRRGAGRPIGALPELWGLTGLERLYPQGRTGSSDALAENAMHTAVTLWSLHQQSHRETGMHRTSGPQLGGAVRQLMPADDIDEPLRKRFVRAGAAPTFDILAQRLREIVVLLRREAVPLDYGLLADQLYRWQLPDGRGEVNRSWGRSFHAYRRPRSTTDGTSADRTGSDHPGTDTDPDTDKDQS
ncbi:type I-E CRISPR-associated protein Cse2/CasB [Kitasatospora purpeofusca]|uniref:type I-E CRISPR-associated protein Cse2/CasB n=1 Tax=Kitasatospora purpeofusca TaxID=67352 RepID=UPI002A59CD81|nr:type I-E CRISPR-associated protein Cse2/CasB [Kitasatospora purpeofusca]MDY0810826.1 type I-E CRISPR-associated protein Cse2/CasB [Kitasatospora purpeofusca]